MNRIEFMTELAALLQDVPIEERRDAMKYYNDYFDDAGEENEKQVVEELESPAKVAATIKADLLSSAREHGEFTEKGYTDSRFDHRDMPAGKGERDGGYQYGQNGYDGQNDYRGGFREEGYQGHGYSGDGQTPPRSSHALKIFLIIMLVVVGAPFIIPFGIAVIAIIFAFGLTILTVFASLVIVSVAVVFVGVCVFIAGLVSLVPQIAVGFALIGTGMILTVIGIVATVASVRLCTIVLPGIFRGIVWVIGRPFHRKAVV